MPNTSRGVLLIQAVLAALLALTSTGAMSTVISTTWAGVVVVVIGAGQVAVTVYAHNRATGASPLAVVGSAALAAAQFIAAGSAVADVVPEQVWGLFVAAVAAVQAGIAWYQHNAGTMPGDPPPYEPTHRPAG